MLKLRYKLIVFRFNIFTIIKDKDNLASSYAPALIWFRVQFPVPTEAPAASAEGQFNAAGPRPRGQAYQFPQASYQQQPRYQTASYSSPHPHQQQQYATEVQPQVQAQPQPQYVARTASRFAVQPQASSQRARIVRRVRRPSRPTTATLAEQQEAEQE